MLKKSIINLYVKNDDLLGDQIKILLFEKNINFQILVFNNDFTKLDLKKLNPYLQLPVLVDRSLILYNVNIIMEYLDERFPHPPLLPVYPILRAQNRLMIYRIFKDWIVKFENILLKKKLSKKFSTDIKVLNKSLNEVSILFSKNVYFLSDHFSLLDCILAPFFWRLLLFEDLKLSEEILIYTNNVFDRRSFRLSLNEYEYELRKK